MTNQMNDLEEIKRFSEKLQESLYTQTVGHLPTAAAYCRAIGLRETIDRLVDSKMHVTPGLCVQAMVLDILTGRSPLYHVKAFLSTCDRELLLGEDVDPNDFEDWNLGRALDAIAECGTGKIITELGIKAVQAFNLDARVVSFDTTSTSVWGEYQRKDDPDDLDITYGYSKDHQPSLKQFMTELLCIKGGIPIFGQAIDGNASDKKRNNVLLQTIGDRMRQHGLGPGAFTYVADSAAVTKDNLSLLAGIRFVSRLPANFSCCAAVIDEALEQKNWSDTFTLQTVAASKNRPSTLYKTSEHTVDIDGQNFRVVVIYSTEKDKRRLKAIQSEKDRALRQVEKTMKKLSTNFFCMADAEKAIEDAAKLGNALYHIEGSLTQTEVRKPGRPPKNGTIPTRTKVTVDWKAIPNPEQIALMEERAGCFALITSIPLDGNDAMDGKSVLETYKGQYAVEQNFAFLKDPIIVNDLFLKKPSRVDALAMVLIIALMVVRLMQHQMRAHLEATNTTVIGLNKQKTKKPTYYAFMCNTRHIAITVYIHGDDPKHKSRFMTKRQALNENQRAYLEALGLDETVFTDKTAVPRQIINGESSA